MASTAPQPTGTKAASGTKVASGTKPFSLFEWMLAGRYLRTRRREGFVSVIAGFSFLGIMLGVAALIVVLSVLNGFRKELLDKFVGLSGHIIVAPLDTPLSDYDAVAKRIAALPGVKRVVPLVVGQAFGSSPYSGSGVLVNGVRAEDLRKIENVAGNILQGTLDNFDDGEGVAIGRRLAESLSLQAGDTFTLITPRGAATPFGIAPRIKVYPIKAVFEIGMTEFDATFVYMPLAQAQAYFNRPDDVQQIEVYLDDADTVDKARAAIEDVAGRPIVLSDWRQRNRTLFGALEVQRNVVFIIVTLIVLVAALNIISGLIMLVSDKSSDIAILRTMGATRGAIMRVFLITGASIGILGTLAGFGAGLLLALNIESIQQLIARTTGVNVFPEGLYLVNRLSAEISPAEVSAVLMMAMVLSLLATLYPSWRAAKLDPVEALRYG